MVENKIKKEIKDVYNIIVETYNNSRKNKTGNAYFFNELMEMPTTLKMIGDVKNKKVLDLGCGPGRYSKILSDKKAKVTGIDNSEKLIEVAQKEAPKANFILGDIEKLPFSNNQFDIVISTLVIGHLKDWNKVLKEVNRVLKKDGIFIFSITGPFSLIKEKQKYFFKRIWTVKDYFKERIVYNFWGQGKIKHKMSHYHKTYGTIIRYLVNNKFMIIDYEDCKPLEEAKKYKEHIEKYNYFSNFPHFCVWKVKKIL